tara:strand:- start:762 stop:1463 length:702 start_codon:yes stop_codon:yes gene_type:complete
MVKIGEILVQKGYVTQQQIDGVLAVKGEGAQIGQVLIEWGLLTEQQLMEALEIQTPPPPVVPPQNQFWGQQPQQVTQPPVQPQVVQPSGGPDLTMDNLQTSKFKIDLKTMIYIGSMLVSGITMYFTFMSELDSRFAALEDTDDSVMVELDKRLTSMETSVDKRLTDLENKFTPIGDGVYSVDPNSTWPPSRGEYKMKDELSRNKIGVLENTIEDLKDEIEKLENKLDKKADKE